MMDEKLKKDIERFGRIEPDYATWVHPWREYWMLFCNNHIDLLVKILNAKYNDYTFYKGEAHICNTIYKVIIINKKD